MAKIAHGEQWPQRPVFRPGTPLGYSYMDTAVWDERVDVFSDSAK